MVLIAYAVGVEGNYITCFSNRMFGLANFRRVVSLMALAINVGMAASGLGLAAIFAGIEVPPVSKIGVGAG